MVDEPSLSLHQVPYSGLVYPGEMIFASDWDPGWGARLTGESFFRIVFLQQVQRVSTDDLQDARIAVCLPGRGQARQRAEVQRELRAIAEVRAVYQTRPDPEAAALQQALRQQEASLRQRLSQQDASWYATGRLVTLVRPSPAAREVFEAGDTAQGVQAIAVALLAWTYPASPIDSSSFPRPLTEEDIPILYRVLISGQASRQERELASAFAPGLRLATAQAPDALNPRDCPALDSIAEALRSHGGVLSWDALSQLVCHARGLPHWLTLLYLLAFARSHPESVQLSLVADHGLTLTDGTPLAGSVLDGFTLLDLPWQPRLHNLLLEVRLVQEPSWEMAAPLATQLQQRLEPAAARFDEGSFSRSLHRLREGLGQASEVLDVLVQATAQPPPVETAAALQRLAQVAQGDRWREFYRACVQLYDRPLALGEDLRQYDYLLQLRPQLPDIRSVLDYLRGVSLSPQQQELALDYEALLNQLRPSALPTTPHLWPSIYQQFLSFVGRYRSIYAAHHTRYREQAFGLAARLEELRSRVDALAAFNTLSELGPPVHPDTPSRYDQLRSQLRLCPVSQEQLPLDTQPICPTCGLQLGDQVPRVEMGRLVVDLTAALREQNRRLGSHAVRQILRTDDELVEKFIRVVQASDLDSLATILDDTVIQFLRTFLAAP